ncbi:sulfurtransferase FdhD [Rhodobaculum claviforme]|uniref:Sulfur carrier protein FdhD n=2 Tax=Rhodobaculum claviforme TaxID=1549854 RepID=A0A934TJW9_9RHOB|nr:formate dehydrogenase accessory sulfurtransferase FdhD [Rhodobaculum claviforme]MBK5927515.1 sulfurtransferase FdhD [Rhodobaculum claviforme]
MRTALPMPRHAWRAGRWQAGTRALPDEVAVALSYNGTAQAVMMATPADLEEFGLGFTLTEGIATRAEVEDITVAEVPGGLDVQMTLAAGAEARLAARRRAMAGPVGCGLCGLDTIAAALGAPPRVGATLTLTPAQITDAMARLPGNQRLHDATRAAHAAAFFTPAGGIMALREDVGRHNALDKLAGALARTGTEAARGAVVLTCRISIDMVQKAAALGTGLVIAASAPTAHAVRMADAAGLTLIGLARADGFEVFTHPHRIPDHIPDRRAADVA